MDRKIVLALAFAMVFLAGSLLVFIQQQNSDPLAQFRAADGKLSIPGGALTKELQQLLFPPKPPETYTTYQPARSAYPTLLIEGIEHKTNEFTSSYKSPSQLDSQRAIVGTIAGLFKPIASMVREAWNFFTGSAQGACTGGACFYIGGTGNFSDITHWSLTSGGLTCACTPGATDSVTFDASSGAGTATQDNATFTSGAAVMTNSSVTISGSSNTWKVGGSWSDANSHFSMSTSTVEFTATGTVTMPDTNGAEYWYNFSVSAGTITVAVAGAGNHRNAVARAFTMTGGALTDGGTRVEWYFFNDGGSSTFFTFSGGTISATSASLLDLIFDTSAGGTFNVNVPSGTFTHVQWGFAARFGAHPTYTLQGNFSVGEIDINDTDAGSDYGLNTGTFNVTANDNGISGSGGSSLFHLSSTSGTWSIAGLQTSNVTNWYWTAGTISVTDTGGCGGGCAYRNGSSNDLWDGSSATYTHSGAGGVWRPGNFTTAIEWGTLTMDTTASAAITMENNGMRVGALTVKNTHATATSLSTTASNFSITATSVTIGSGGTLTANASTITVSGNWNSSAGTFTPGTSTVVFAASGTMTVGNPSPFVFNVYNLTINTGATMTTGADIGVKNQLVLSGTGSIAGGNSIGIGYTNTVSQVDPLTIGSGTLGGIVLYITNNTTPGNFNVPASANYTTLNPWPRISNATVTLTGNITAQRFNINNDTAGVTGTKVDANTRTVTVTGDLYVGWFGGSSIAGALVFSSGHIDVAGTVTVNANSGTYIQWGSSTAHIIKTGWVNNSTSGSWNAGTGTVEMRWAAGAQTFTPGTGVGNEFNNLLFGSSSGGVTFTLGANLQIAAELCGSPFNGSVNLNTSASGNYSMTIGSLCVNQYQGGGFGVLTLNASTVTVNGSWNSGSGHVSTLTQGTSTVTMNATGNLTTAASSGAATFYNLKITSGTTTLKNNIGVGAVLTVNGGTFTDDTTSRTVYLRADSNTANPLVYSSGSIQSTGSQKLILNWFIAGSSTVIHIPSGTYTSVDFTYEPIVSIGGDGLEYRLDGNITLEFITFLPIGSASFFNTQTFNVTISAFLDGGSNSANTGIKATSGTFALSGMLITGIPNFYIQYGASNWNLTGSASGFVWNLVGVNADATGKWSYGTATVTFNTTTTLTRYSSGTTAEFPNLTMNYSSGASVTYHQFSTDARTLKVNGTLTIQDTGGGGTTEYTTLNSDNATVTNITAGAVTVGTSGILTANSATITVSGNWTSSAGTFTFGTSTVVLAATGSLTFPAATQFYDTVRQFYSLTINSGVTTTLLSNQSIRNILTVNGTVTGTGWIIGVGYGGSQANPLVIGGSGNPSGIDQLVVSEPVAFNVPGSANYPALWIAPRSGTTTATITGNITSTNAAFGTMSRCQGDGVGDIGICAFGANNWAVVGGLGLRAGGDVSTQHGRITFTSGTLSTGALNIFTASSSMSWGSSTGHTVSGAYTNSSTDASWSSGTGTVTFDLDGSHSYTFAGTNLAGNEFNNVNFTSQPNGVTATMLARGLRLAGTLNVGDADSTLTLSTGADLPITASTIEASNNGTIIVNGSTLTFVTLFATLGEMKFSGTNGQITASNFSMSTGAGTIVFIGTDWDANDRATPQIQWTFNPDTAGATVTLTFGDMTPGEIVTLFRDGTDIPNAVQSITVDPTGHATFTVTGGWSPHDMFILPTAGPSPPGGGGGGGTPPPNTTAKLTCQPLSGYTYQCTVTPATGETINRVVWDFGDGSAKTSTTGNSAVHSYAQPGTYAVVADVSYASGKADRLTQTVTIASGPSILEYLIAIVFLISAIGTLVSRKHAKMFLGAMTLITTAWMLFLFPVTAFPVFLPRLLVQGIVLLGGIAAMVYGLLPQASSSSRQRLFWVIWGALMVILFFLTR